MTSAPQVGRENLAELTRPAADRLVADLDPAPGEQLLDLTQTEREAEIQPHRMADHKGGESVPFVEDSFHRAIAKQVITTRTAV